MDICGVPGARFSHEVGGRDCRYSSRFSSFVQDQEKRKGRGDAPLASNLSEAQPSIVDGPVSWMIGGFNTEGGATYATKPFASGDRPLLEEILPPKKVKPLFTCTDAEAPRVTISC